MPETPLVTVLTPVYNGQTYLRECVESVLHQTYPNFEYIIVNNCSSDGSLEIAREYAARDARLRIETNKEFVGVAENHNIAFRLVSPHAKYCKVVSADDFIAAECLSRLVKTAETQPTAGFIGCYQLSGDRVLWQGFPYPQTHFKGPAIGRKFLLGEDPTFGLGCPTSLLYRADLVRSSESFFPDSSLHADTSACIKHLKDWDYAFVHEILSFDRTHSQSQRSRSEELNCASSADLDDLLKYGRQYLSEEEWRRRVKQQVRGYYAFLSFCIFRRKASGFWKFHKRRLRELGYPITLRRLAWAGMLRVMRAVMSRGRALGKIWQRFQRRSAVESL